MTEPERILLSPPDLRGGEIEALRDAIASGWVTTAGPALERFEAEIAARSQRRFAVGVTSGTAGLQLALLAAGVGPGMEVGCSTLTFVATANAIVHTGATPVFFDSDAASWNIDANLVEAELARRARSGNQLAALITVDLYGQCADYTTLEPLCEKYGVTLIEDAAEALGSTCSDRAAGSFGQSAAFSFNGNKIITTSGGGMVVTDDRSVADQVRYLSTQARQPVRHYEHTDVGYNYRLSNLLAAVGSNQLATLDARVERRRVINNRYRTQLGPLAGWTFMPEAEYGTCIFWLTCATVDPAAAPINAHALVERLDADNIESRPVWKPMHLQPLFADATIIGGSVAESLFVNGLCLPSGSSLTDDQIDRVCAAVHAANR